MNQEDFDSDASDEDYVPGGAGETELPSEEESDGEPEEDVAEESGNKRGKKRSKNKSKRNVKLKVEETCENEENKEEKPLTEEDEKKKADSLWADFMKDTDFKPKQKTDTNTKISQNKKITVPVINKPEQKTTVTKVYEFAGEEVRVTKEVPIDSIEARINPSITPSSSSNSVKPRPSRGRGGLGGISSVLSRLGKKEKISTLEKSKLDWDSFKKDENIEDELEAHNKGKNGYLERQDFLQRADLRQFEIEKAARATQRSQRLL